MSLPPESRDALLEALRRTRVAAAAAKEVGVHPTTAWRMARKHGIQLISLSEHMKNRRGTPPFLARQAPAQRKAASAWLKARHLSPDFREKSVEAGRQTLTRLNLDPAFRRASGKLLKDRYADPAFRRKQAEGASRGMKAFHCKRRPRSKYKGEPKNS